MFSLPEERECPCCGETHVVKNGIREGQQQFRCRSCGAQFSDREEACGHRFSAQVIARSIELRLEGMSYRKTAADVQREFSISDTTISQANIHRWFEKYINIAVEETQKLSAKTVGPWRVSYVSLHPAGHSQSVSVSLFIIRSLPPISRKAEKRRLTQPQASSKITLSEGGCWVVQDQETSYVLAAHAYDSFDPAVAAELNEKIQASMDQLEGNFNGYSYSIDEDFGIWEILRDPLEAIELQSGVPSYNPHENFMLMPAHGGIFSPSGAFWRALQIMRRQNVFHSPDSRQLFLDGWALKRNFFVNPGDPEGTTPAELAGVEASFKSWLDVVNYRGTATTERKRRRKAGL